MSAQATTYERVPVLDSWDETPKLRAIRVSLGVLASGHSAPGQVVKLKAQSGEAYFALASAPSPTGLADLLVKRGGRIADEAIATAAPGTGLWLSSPFGKGFPVSDARAKDVLLFAAGSGIAPIRALIEYLIQHREHYGRVTLFYGQRKGEDFAYRTEHMDWERRGVRVVLCPSGPDDAWQGVRGRVQAVARSLAFGGAPPVDGVAFVCGMSAMVNEVKATLKEAGVAPEHVHLNF